MLTTVDRSAQAYYQIYRGSTLLLKVSGAEIASCELPTLAQDIRDLTRNGIRVILCFGGGEQIDQHWQRHHPGEERVKIDGVAVTHDAHLQDGVLPAHEEIRTVLARLLPTITLLPPPAIHCTFLDREKYDLVGQPSSIEIPQSATLMGAGFVGEVDGTTVNVNADDVARAIVAQQREQLRGAVLLTPKGGVCDRRGNLVPLLTRQSLATVLSGEHPSIRVDGGMRKKLKEVDAMLPEVGKVAITKISKLRDEITQWRGSGTLCIDEMQLELGQMLAIEDGIFDAVYEEYVRRGIFRQRSREELRTLRQHHWMLRAKNSPLGGCSLVPTGDGWDELSVLWADLSGNGVAERVIREALQRAGSVDVYALSTQQEVVSLFERCGFHSHGDVRSLLVSPTVWLPHPLLSYNTAARNPTLVTRRHSASP